MSKNVEVLLCAKGTIQLFRPRSTHQENSDVRYPARAPIGCSGGGGIADVDASNVVALGAFKDQTTRIDIVAAACALRCAAEGQVRAVDAGRALNYGDLAAIVAVCPAAPTDSPAVL